MLCVSSIRLVDYTGMRFDGPGIHTYLSDQISLTSLIVIDETMTPDL